MKLYIGALLCLGLINTATAFADNIENESQTSEVASAEAWAQIEMADNESNIENFFGMSFQGDNDLAPMGIRDRRARRGDRRRDGGRYRRPLPPGRDRYKPNPPRRRPRPRPAPQYYYVCTAESASGYVYQARGRWSRDVQNYALNMCYARHPRCFVRGCYRRYN